MLCTDVKGDRGLPFPTLRHAAVGRWNEASGVRGRGSPRCGIVGSLGGSGGGSVEGVIKDLRGEPGRTPGFVGDDEQLEAIKGTRGKGHPRSAARVFEASVDNPPGADAERGGENIPRV
jgi:hypothetical protein